MKWLDFQSLKSAFLCFQDGKWNIEEEEEEDNEEEDDNEEDGDTEEGEEDEEEEGEEEGGVSSEEEDGHSDLESENESEDEERKLEAKETSAKPLSQEELKAQQQAAKSELPYTFAGTYTQTDKMSSCLCRPSSVASVLVCSSRELRWAERFAV